MPATSQQITYSTVPALTKDKLKGKPKNATGASQLKERLMAHFGRRKGTGGVAVTSGE